ncbi:hypothetical protein AALP_AA6G352300 [Arabis alpina]|uniref:DDT domain-containing protein n=1 Tax=Arabis alpina TaxID=50452 RepID=A0A087GTR4_ARAAL|nr:hypothetical protein AALP_AA6G352300 [Arabis alpina]
MAVVSNEQNLQAPNPDVTVAAETGTEESTGGKTCHQCRQKRPVIGSCVAKKGNTTCLLQFCPSCLRNRYGEKAEEVVAKTDWVCPKCRGNCNCSICRKKNGYRPTGILAHTAKATGFSSVSELLKTEGHDKYFYQRKVKLEDAAPLELGQENATEQTIVEVKKSKNAKRKELKDMNNGGGDDQAAVETSSRKRIKASDAVQETDGAEKAVPERKNKKTAAAKIKKPKPVLKKKEEYQLEEIMPPQGTGLITVSRIELPPDDAGDALQFLEFCSAFEKALDLRKGQAESVIREMFAGRNTRRQQHSTLTQMIIQILTLILKDRGQTSVCMSATDSSWFTAVGICFLESEVKYDDFPPEFFKKGIAAYEELDSSKRLKLLNFLCDEALGTSLLRDCIDDVETTERKKEGKEMLNAAKEKEKQLKQKLEDELAKAVAENNGVPLTTEERDAVESQMNDDAEEVRSEMLSAMEMLSTKSQKCNDALRTKPLEVDDNGLVFWKLNCYNEEPNILVQDLGSGSDEIPQEKWSAFSPEQKPQLEKYIPFVRMKRRQAKQISKQNSKQNASTST